MRICTFRCDPSRNKDTLYVKRSTFPPVANTVSSFKIISHLQRALFIHVLCFVQIVPRKKGILHEERNAFSPAPFLANLRLSSTFTSVLRGAFDAHTSCFDDMGHEVRATGTLHENRIAFSTYPDSLRTCFLENTCVPELTF
jgi:hypothetical protein